MKRVPVIIGLLGGIASGKSTVAGLLRHLGARVVDADRIAHEILERPEVRRRLAEEFGSAILDAGGGVSRRKVGEIVFADDQALSKLNAMVHPLIRERISAEIRTATEQLVVLDAPLILEGELERIVDVLVYVQSPESIRRSRAARRSGWTAEEHALRESRQASLEVKRRQAVLVIVNDGSLAELRGSVEKLHGELLAQRKRAEG